ncbi:DNA-binding protein HU-beta [Natronocella acetinitrilica]|uniref:DNA-binding protein HU-beta n=1 Tax=Natronocella acetinitrilica TaxID=414046 RepID=A0AAE3G328_9GAMM|nr:HU family DNA-binding protein [Natronocella acetinitrilica]MCP1674144.1 DNA-binding protein HU-beta [Natronocella acetinitrilica]
MNKSELISSIAESAGMSQAEAGRALDALTDAVTRTLAKGDDVTLVGFGTFRVTERAAREGRNPRTGESIKIAASKQPTFKAGAGLKAAVN